jgi:hypothetical protein
MNRNLSPAQARRIGLAAHEAGHAVVGVLYGATIDQASLTADGDDGLCSFDADSFGAEARVYRSHIAAAGAVAAAMFHYGPRLGWQQIDDQLHGTDRDELRAAAFSGYGQPMSAPLMAVRPLVQRCWTPIVKLATEMYFGRNIGHDDVCTALGLTDEGGSYSAELAMIRSGRVPGTFTMTRGAAV